MVVGEPDYKVLLQNARKPERPNDDEAVDFEGNEEDSEDVIPISGCVAEDQFDQIKEQADDRDNKPRHRQAGFSLGTNQTQKSKQMFEFHLPSSVDEERADDDVSDADDDEDDTQG